MAIIKSVNKTYLGSAAPNPKDPNLLIFRVDDVKTFPARDANGIRSVSDLILNENAKGIGIYCTPITRADAGDGEYPSRGFIATITGTAPGDRLALNEIVQNLSNEDVVIITKGCESDLDTRFHGSKCAPLSLSVEETDSNEGTSKVFTFTQVIRYKYKSMHYSGAIPAIEEYAASDYDSAAAQARA
jgi:hypothetical protein